MMFSGVPQRSIRNNALSLMPSLAFTLAISGPVSASVSYEGLFESMKDRQAEIESHLLDPARCLGERLDGFLEINANCSEEARALAAAENQDRLDLNLLMSKDLNLSHEQVGRDRADRYVERYLSGILREVRISDSETTWWDGLPPDPRKTPMPRVLALRYARIYTQPDFSSRVVRDNVQQYEAFGVVDSASKDGEDWFKVTEEYVPKVKPPGWSPMVLGWIAEKDTIPWRRAVVMRFTSPYKRDQSLFFREPDPLLNLIEDDLERRNKVLDAIRSEAQAGRGASKDVIALEPRVGPGQEHMIMYPVLEFYGGGNGKDLRIAGKSARLLKVAARTRADAEDKSGSGSQDAIPIDILFVMDTTNSMKRYLKDVVAAVEEFAEMSANDGIRFGFIGYQDKHPAFEYKVKQFTQSTQPAKLLVGSLRQVKARPSPVRGDDFPEAVFDGLDAAMESDQWRDRAIKIVFLIGDAPGREEGKLSLKTLRDKAFTRKIRIFAFFIRRSAKSSSLDRLAAMQYRKLSSTFEGAYGTSHESSHGLTIDAGSLNFRNLILDRFREAQGSFHAVGVAAAKGLDSLPETNPGSLSDLIFERAAALLADDSLPETDVRGWICDKVLTNPGREALAPMILLSETELDELAQRVRELKEVGEKALRGEEGTTLDFFDLVNRNTKITMVNPTAVNFRDAFSIPLGIDQLPYDSDIMAMTREEFQNMDRVQDFVRSMTNKLLHYEDLRLQRGDPDIWKKLSTGAHERDRVVGVELKQLP